MINEVRNTVLSVLNKNNYGYLSPSDFNLFATNAQMEIYEEYFSSYNKAINFENARQAGVDYADMEQALAETIESFIVVDDLTQDSNTNRFFFPSLTTTGNEAFMVSNIVLYGPEGEQWGEAEKVTNGRINLLLNSNLTKPTTHYPVYVLQDSKILVYPEEIKDGGTVKMTYFRYPKPPKWTYTTLSNGEPVFDQSQPDYQDFELPPNDAYKLTMKILQYAGVSIREMDVTQFGMAQEQHEQPTFSQKQ